MSNPIKVSEEAADHVQEVDATHSHLPSQLPRPPGPETENTISIMQNRATETISNTDRKVLKPRCVLGAAPVRALPDRAAQASCALNGGGDIDY